MQDHHMRCIYLLKNLSSTLVSVCIYISRQICVWIGVCTMLIARLFDEEMDGRQAWLRPLVKIW